MSVYGTIKKIYKRVLPIPIRRRLFMLTPMPLKKIRHKLIGLLESVASHDEIYDAEYYTGLVDVHMAKSCDIISRSIISEFGPRQIVDVGCGSGLLLLAFHKQGIASLGLELATDAVEICQQRGLDVIQFDLECDDLPENMKADVAVSTEVAEHLPEACAERYVKILCQIADVIVFTAAEPRPERFDTNHVNEQPESYWIDKFQANGYEYDQKRSLSWRADWKHQGVSPCHYETLMIFYAGRD